MVSTALGVSVKRRKKTNIACINCSKSHVTCESKRPCSQCIKKGLDVTCVNAPRKRRKYLADVPEDQLPVPLKQLEEEGEGGGEETTILAEMSNGLVVTHMDAGNESQFRDREHQFQDQDRIVHKPRFLSSAANLEYSTLSDIIHQDTLLNKIPVSLLYNGTDSSTPSPDAFTTSHANNISPREQQQRSVSQLTMGRPMSGLMNDVSTGRYALGNLLGPHTEEILCSNVDIMKVHFPLIPTEVTDDTLDFKRLLQSANIPQKFRYDKSVNQHFLSLDCTLPEVGNIGKGLDAGGRSLSFSVESKSPDEHLVQYRPDWPHSLRYGTPMEIYTLVSEPFSHTSGFHSLLKYLHSRFGRRDLVDMCRSIAEFRPIFIASAVDLTEEDMIFMEQSYQRTLLEYDKFISQIGTPTCVWRRNGQISYLNDEFSVLTGWTREELLNKMTFIVELMDDSSVREYFKTFSKVAYKDFKGFEQMETCTLLTPIKGRSINCCCMWTWKRDVFGMPMMIVGHFLPIIPIPVAIKHSTLSTSELDIDDIEPKVKNKEGIHPSSSI
ncbi:Ert1p Ecym_2265 [Eremothecium cymbalariae DBVPG|uniref:Zn(2)-C6 fungal-type domain-containing protein n=1 Tax=Eremothecium cymbalariae (strain CBS 270.75 / DBVPG 7215 / KCTC 17166 / NRRL Y-17582) TaxID=931890 RepID=G8JPQ6_ERECY|nr:Hypothetical protein Ecym_2265 [Eremothecium cymbalariae DBVPG\